MGLSKHVSLSLYPSPKKYARFEAPVWLGWAKVKFKRAGIAHAQGVQEASKVSKLCLEASS